MMQGPLLDTVERKQIKLRPYQQELVRLALEAPEDRVCLYGPTGSGKTEVGMTLVRHFADKGLRVYWLANRIDLIEQTSGRFAVAGIDHGIVQGSHRHTSWIKPVQVCSIQTVNRRKRLPDCDVIVLDEAHGAVAPMYRAFLDAQDVPVYGLTATPFSRALGTVFQKLIHTSTIRSLTDEGWLVPARYFAPDRPNLKGVRMTAGDYNEADLAARVDLPGLVGNIVDEYLARAAGKKAVVFATSIDHSKHIVEQFKFRGVAAEHIDAYTDPAERKQIIRRYRQGDTTILSNVSVLAEGFDCPDMEVMILARPTKSIIRYLQMVGRVLRPSANKVDALVLDHSATVETLGFADEDRPLVLDDGTKKERKKNEQEKPPHVCPKCKAVTKKRRYPCAHCGFMPERTSEHGIDVHEGTLAEIKATRYTLQQRQEIWGALLSYCEAKGYKQGWAAHSYRDICGVWPRGLSDTKGPINEVVKKYLIHKQIRWAKAKEKAGGHFRHIQP